MARAADIDKSFPIDVFDVVAMGLWKHCGLFGGIFRNETAKIRAAIAAVGLDGFEARAVATLSGGQMQRMLFARLLVQDAAVILLDEPLPRSTPKLSPILFLVREYFPQTLLLAREEIAKGKTDAVFIPENLFKARSMIEAFDRQAQACALAA